MNEDEEIIILTPDEVEDDAEESDGAPPSRSWRKGGLYLGLGVVLGAVLAGGAAWHFRPVPFDPSPLRAEIDSLRAEIETLKAKPEPVMPTVDLGPLNRRIAALEDQPQLEPIDEALVARLEALKADGFELPDLPEIPDISPLESRLDVLETQVTTLQDAPPVIIRSEADATAEPYIDPATLPRFPEGTLREGAAELAGSGFARRLIARHVRVKGSDAPSQMISEIERHLNAGQPRAALELFDQLPPELASLARAWRADMEDALEAQTPMEAQTP